MLSNKSEQTTFGMNELTAVFSEAYPLGDFKI
jgi:hypothetical protein